MRPTNFCHLNDTAFTRTSCVPGSLRGFHRVDVPRSLGLRATYQGTECFTALANASADLRWTHAALPLESLAPHDAGALERGFVIPTVPTDDRASDTSVASPSSAESSVRLRAAFFSDRLDALASSGAVPREEAAKVALTIAS
jgi:hypothetical protein